MALCHGVISSFFFLDGKILWKSLDFKRLQRWASKKCLQETIPPWDRFLDDSLGKTQVCFGRKGWALFSELHGKDRTKFKELFGYKGRFQRMYCLLEILPEFSHEQILRGWYKQRFRNKDNKALAIIGSILVRQYVHNMHFTLQNYNQTLSLQSCLFLLVQRTVLKLIKSAFKWYRVGISWADAISIEVEEWFSEVVPALVILWMVQKSGKLTSWGLGYFILIIYEQVFFSHHPNVVASLGISSCASSQYQQWTVLGFWLLF